MLSRGRISELLHKVWRVPDPAFYADFSDAGAGICNITAAKGGVSPTFTRASTATTVLANGLLGSVASGQPRGTYDPASFVTNLLPQSQSLDQAEWQKFALTVAPNVHEAPDGTLTADAIIPDAGSGTHYTVQGFTSVAGVNTWSVYLKDGGLGNPWHEITVFDDVTNFRVWINLATGQIGSTAGAVSASVTACPKGWYRLAVTATLAASAVGGASFYIVPRGSDGPGFGDTTGNGVTPSTFVWGAQLERAASVGQYVPTTGAAASAHGRYLGYLNEATKTNLNLHSEALDNAAWSKANVTIAANQIVAPDGATTAGKIQEDSTLNVQHYVYPTVGPAANANTVYTVSAFVKAGERTKGRVEWVIGAEASGVYATFDLIAETISAATAIGTGTATASSIVKYPNGWYRVSVSGKLDAASTVGYSLVGPTDSSGNWVYAGTVGFGLYAWGVQTELNDFPTSYIPTAASGLSRSSDSLTYPSSPWFNASAGTLYTEHRVPPFISVNGHVSAALYDGTIDNRIQSYYFNTDEFLLAATSASATQINLLVKKPVVLNAAAKEAIAYANADYAISYNGESADTQLSGSLPIGITTLIVGSTSNGALPLFAPIRQVRYWNTRLDNATLQRLTGA